MGKRLLGVVCLLRYLADSEIVSVQARRIDDINIFETTKCRVLITLGLKMVYLAQYTILQMVQLVLQKERIEVFAGGKVI